MANNGGTSGAGAWPAVEYEPHPWVRTGEEVASRRALMRARGDYEAAVPPMIADVAVVVWGEVQALAADASGELARFDAEVGTIAAPFTGILLRTESASSSEIENLTASAKQVALAELGASDSANARLVAANVRAMEAALAVAESINEESIIAMHAALLEESDREHTGRFRDQQVWIGGGGISPHEATFVPPHHSRVQPLMRDLVQFAGRTDIPVLLQAALAHAQFETIHPFTDGNGRTGRALIHTILKQGGLTRNLAVPVSAGLLANTQRYFDALGEFRSGNPEAIIGAVAQAAFHAVENGSRLVTDLRECEAAWAELIPARRGSAVARLSDVLLAQPVVTTQIVAERLRVSIPAAQNAIDRFVAAGALLPVHAQRRNRVWFAPQILAALDSFGSRARRAR